MKILFRTEGNHSQGMGDLWSSIAMADAFRDIGHEAGFLVSGGQVAIDLIKRRGYVTSLAPTPESEHRWLRQQRQDVVVVNKLCSPASYVEALKRQVPFVVTVEDNGPGGRAADLAINTLYHTEWAVTCPSYLMLRDEFAHRARGEVTTRQVQPRIRELLVTQGGSDTYGFTPLIVQAIADAALGAHVTLVLGPAFRHDAALAAVLATTSCQPTVVRDAKNMPALMAAADLAVTAGGITMFELASLGVPSLVVCAERFEEETAARLEAQGAVRQLGFGGDLDSGHLTRELARLAGDMEARRRMSIAGPRLVDGGGAARVAELICRRAAAKRRVPAGDATDETHRSMTRSA